MSAALERLQESEQKVRADRHEEEYPGMDPQVGSTYWIRYFKLSVDCLTGLVVNSGSIPYSVSLGIESSESDLITRDGADWVHPLYKDGTCVSSL